MVKKGLLRELVLGAGRVVFDPKTGPHTTSSRRRPAASMTSLGCGGRVAGGPLKGSSVHEYQVVMRGRAAALAAR